MLTTHFHCSRIAAILGLVASLNMATATARAEEPERVLRTFAYSPFDFSAPDFLDEDSVAVFVLPESADPDGAGLELPILKGPEEDEYDLWWIHPARSVNKGGTKLTGDFYWLLDEATPTPPPAGAHTFTGPDGWIESVEVTRIKLCASNSCGGDSRKNGWWTIDSDYGTRVFVIVTAWFSK